jgi:hypothetical protein
MKSVFVIEVTCHLVGIANRKITLVTKIDDCIFEFIIELYNFYLVGRMNQG